MKTVTNNYKNELKKMGKELDNIITYRSDETTITLNNELLSNINYHYEGNILKSVMKQLDFETFNEIPKETELNYRFGIKVNNSYEYIDYGTFIVKEVEKLEDTNTYKITCYDKMLYSMVDYEDLGIEYPITIKNYLQAICTKLGLTLKDDNFANQDNEIENELYLDSEGNSLGYTFRDVLDEIAQATGSTICINDNDELEVRYIDEAINETQEAEGTDLTLTDSEDGQIRGVSLKGNTSQVQYTGNQLIDYTAFSKQTYITINGENITINNTSAKMIYATMNFTDYEAGAYSLKLVKSAYSGSDTLIYLQEDENNYSTYHCIVQTIGSSTTTAVQSKTFTDTLKRIMICVPSGASMTISLMMVKGTYTESNFPSYEPYVGGTASPNPNYPQNVNVVSGDNTITIANSDDTESQSYNVNLGSLELCKIGTYQDKIFKGKGTNIIGLDNQQYKVDLKTGDKITMRNDTPDSLNINLYTNYGDTTRNDFWSLSANTTRTITIAYDTKAIAWSYTPNGIAYANLGNTLLTYEPYGAKDKWLLHKEIGKAIYDGSNDESWQFQNTSTTGLYRCNLANGLLKIGYYNAICNYFKMSNETQFANITTPSFATHPNVQTLCFWHNETTLNNWKTWLSTHNVLVYYVLANPTTEEITNSELLGQLKAIDKAKTYEGTTNITSTFPLSLTYVSEFEVIDEELVKNTRASFDKTYSPINSLVLSRSADSDNIYIQDEDSIEENGLHELKIADNQILNGNNRDEYINEIFEKVNGLTYSYNDYESIGITYLDLCDRYRVSLRDNTYKCVMFNDEIEVNNGLNEIIYTDEAEESKTDYTKADKTDRRINQTTLIVDKQQGQINSLVEKVVDVSSTANGIGSITLENAHEGNLHYLSIKGNISRLYPANNVYPKNDLYPIGPTLLIDNVEYTLDIDKLRYVNNTLCDEFVYKDGECYIIRRLNSSNQALANEVIEERESIILQVNSSSTISLKHFNSAILSCEYLLENVYTDNFASQVDVKSEIIQTENSITQKVSAVADDEGNVTSGSIMLAINKDESQATIQADKISLEGKEINLTSDNVTIDSNNFKVDSEGNMVCNNAVINGNLSQTMISDGYNTQVNIGDPNNTGQAIEVYSYDETSGDEIFKTYLNPGNVATYQNGHLEAIFGYGGVVQLYDITRDVRTINLEGYSGKITCVTLAQTSLEESKKNIKKFNNALDEILKTDIYEYNLINESNDNKKHLGFVIGKKRNYSNYITSVDESGNEIGVDTYSMTSLCLQAIKEQQKQIEELKEEIKKLKGDEK